MHVIIGSFKLNTIAKSDDNIEIVMFPLERMQAHHIMTVAHFPLKIAHEDNIQLLCADCHHKMHSN